MAKGKTGGGDPVDVMELRKKLGPLVGEETLSRLGFARLVGASHGSILNWERGKPPMGKYADRLRKLATDIAAGTIKAEDLTSGRRKKPGRVAKAAKVAKPVAEEAKAEKPTKVAAKATKAAKRNAASTTIAEVDVPAVVVASASGDEPLIYANHASVVLGAYEARIAFTLKAPGEARPRSVATVLVPKSCLEAIRRGLPT